MHGRAVPTFSWKIGEKAQSTLVDFDFSQRLQLAATLISLARTVDWVIADGRSEDDGMLYYSDVAHLLESGCLPRFLGEMDDTGSHREKRFACYTGLTAIARGA